MKKIFFFEILASLLFLTPLAWAGEPHPESSDLYLRLGLERKVLTTDEIKKAYRTAAKSYHPDKTLDPALKEKYARYFQNLNEAYETLLKDAGKNPPPSANRRTSPPPDSSYSEKPVANVISHQDIRFRLEQLRGGDSSLKKLIVSIRTLHGEFLQRSSAQQFLQVRYAVALTVLESFPEHLRDVKTIPELTALFLHVDLANSRAGEYVARLKPSQLIEMFDKALTLSLAEEKPLVPMLTFIRTALSAPHFKDQYLYAELYSRYLQKVSSAFKMEPAEVIQRAFAPLYLSNLDLRKMNQTWNDPLARSVSRSKLEKLTLMADLLNKMKDPEIDRFLRSVNDQLVALKVRFRKGSSSKSTELYQALDNAAQASFTQRTRWEASADAISWQPGDGAGHSVFDCVRLFFSLR